MSWRERWRAFYLNRWNGWLERRIPIEDEIVLDQRRIFIFLTRLGVLYCVLLLALFVGGLNYGNNLLLGLAFLLAGVMFVAVFYTYRNLAGLAVRGVEALSAHVGEPVEFVLRLRSESGRDYYALNIDWLETKEVIARCGEEQDVRFLLHSARRGYWHPPRLKLESRFPLGLLRAWTWLDPGLSALVWPAPIRGDLPLQSGVDTAAGAARPVPGYEDFALLREYQPGNPLQHISWPHFARGQGLQVKTFETLQMQGEVLDYDGYPGLDQETRLSRLCYWVIKFSESGQRFGLRLPGLNVAVSGGIEHRRRCLDALGTFGEKHS